MRWLAVAAMVLALVAPAAAQTRPPFWVTGALVTNPATNQVLVSTTFNSTNAGAWLVAVYVYSDVGTPAILQQVNNVGTVVRTVQIPGSVSFIFFQGPMPLTLVAGDTLRVISRGNVVGEAQAVLFLRSS